jgi:hypothetical protein
MGTAVAIGVREAGEVADAVARMVAGFDADLVSASDAMVMMKSFDRIKRLGAAGETLCAGRVASTELWRRNGHRSAANWMAGETGVGVGDAVRVLETAKALEHADATAEAFKAGELSPRQAKVIAGAAAVAPGVEAELLRAADRLSIRELEDKARRLARGGSTESEQQREARAQSERILRTWVEDGLGCGLWKVPLAKHARIMAVIGVELDRIFHQARRDGVREPVEAYAVDALVAMAEKATGVNGTGTRTSDRSDRSGSKPGNCGGHSARDVKIIVRVDHTALIRGEVAKGELCEIAGLGPVDLATVEDWMAADAIKAAIVTEGVDIRSIVHLGRSPIELQRTALQWHSAGTCAIEGCTSTARMEIDHVQEWAATHQTTLDDLALVCGHHHDLKTHRGYRFGPLGENGRRTLIAPDARPGDSPDTS